MAEIRTKRGTIEVRLGFRVLEALSSETATPLKEMGDKIDAFDFAFMAAAVKHLADVEGDALEALLDEPGFLVKFRVAFTTELMGWIAVSDFADDLDEKKD
jgi:hypothetical protein